MEQKEWMKRVEELEKQLAFIQKKYHLVIDNMDCAVWEYDCDTHFLHQEKKLGGKYENENLDIADYRNTIRGWGIVHPEDVAIFEAYCDSMDNGDESYSYEFRTLTDDENYMWQRYEGNTIRDKDGKIIKIIGKTLNVNREYKEREELRIQSETDALTGLLNKGAFQEEMAKFFSRYQRGPVQEKHAVYIMDIDNFKGINDTYGHMFGDYVLEQYASQLGAVFQEKTVIGRIGGDEFAVIRKHISGRFEAEKYAKLLNTRIREMQLKSNARITTSIGISVFPSDGQDYSAIFRAADIALYEVKSQGKDGYAFYHGKAAYDMKRELTELRGREGAVKPDSASGYRKLEKQVAELLEEKYYYRQLMGDGFFYYVIDEDYRILFKEDGQTGGYLSCYRQMGMKEPCRDCPIQYMDRHDKQYSVDDFDGKNKRWYVKKAVRLESEGGKRRYAVCRGDVTRLMGRRNMLDEWTNLPTMENFEAEVMEILSESVDEYYMVCIGYKHFDAICRQFGCKAEKELAGMAGRQFRYSLGEGELAARAQGQSFFLFLRGDTAVFDRVHMIMKVLQHDTELNYPGISAYMEAGVYAMKENTVPVMEAVDCAEYARQSLKVVRERRRNEFVFFDAGLQEQYRKEKRIRREMYQSFLNEEFVIRFLPVADDRGKIIGAKLTTEWMNGEKLLWEQKDYLPVFEKYHFLCDFGIHIAEKTFAFIQQWQSGGKVFPVVTFALVADEVWDSGIFSRLSDLAGEYGIMPERIRMVIEGNMTGINTDKIADIIKVKGFLFSSADNPPEEISGVSVSPEEFGILLDKQENM